MNVSCPKLNLSTASLPAPILTPLYTLYTACITVFIIFCPISWTSDSLYGQSRMLCSQREFTSSFSFPLTSRTNPEQEKED